jgi:hypothetical protein
MSTLPVTGIGTPTAVRWDVYVPANVPLYCPPLQGPPPLSDALLLAPKDSTRPPELELENPPPPPSSLLPAPLSRSSDENPSWPALEQATRNVKGTATLKALHERIAISFWTP